jgi:hypothetical protein
MGTMNRQLLFGILLASLIVWGAGSRQTCATDYFLTIGGGYSPRGNQASLEANVVFFQQLLAHRHQEHRRHDIFFADGDDPGADLQVIEDQPERSDTPATDLLAALHRRRGADRITYRNHRIEDIAGPLDPKLIQKNLEALSLSAGRGDRLIVYVTAHGSQGPEDDKFNTTIDCWNERKIEARQFTAWLDKLPADLPVVMVMAQCYCGGFGHTIFRDLDEDKGLAPPLRVGFFAQQHDLPAAGCRPDIEHDEEFSSYFWGAMAGRSRNGVPIEGVDIDGNGTVSFFEAFAYAVIAGDTIDIPLRSSEVLLRDYSRVAELKSDRVPAHDDLDSEEGHLSTAPVAERPLLGMSGKLEAIIEISDPVSSHIVRELTRSLELSVKDDVVTVTSAYEEARRASRRQARGRGARQSSGRRDLLREVAEKWPELGDSQKWTESSLLAAENQAQLMGEIKLLPSWKTYDERNRQNEAVKKARDQAEIRTVKFRRLLNTLEVIVLERNLPLVAAQEIVERYKQMRALEGSALANSGSN